MRVKNISTHYHSRPISVCPKFKALCIHINSEDPAELSLYIKVQDIRTGRSKTPLIVASYVVIYMCVFSIFEQHTVQPAA